MILALAAGAGLAAAAYFAVKHYGSAAIVAAVKAEISAAEAKLPALEASAKAEVSKLVAAIKAKLGL